MSSGARAQAGLPRAPWSLAQGSSQLADNVTYDALAGVTNQQSNIMPVEFRMAEVKRLQPDQVLSKPDGTADVITRSTDFVKQAQAAC